MYLEYPEVSVEESMDLKVIRVVECEIKGSSGFSRWYWSSIVHSLGEERSSETLRGVPMPQPVVYILFARKQRYQECVGGEEVRTSWLVTELGCVCQFLHSFRSPSVEWPNHGGFQSTIRMVRSVVSWANVSLGIFMATESLLPSSLQPLVRDCKDRNSVPWSST
jgi:hypothetical protein